MANALSLRTSGASLLWLLSSSLGHSQTVNQPLQVRGDVQLPVLVKQVDPKFSSKMRKRPADMDVLIHLVVDEHGLPLNTRVVPTETNFLTEDPEFDRSALRAVEQYRFKPATRQGVPVAVELNVQVHFHVQQK